MGNKFNKFQLLMWKNWLLLRRRPIHTAFEIVLPFALCFILVAIRGLIEPTVQQEIIYGPFGVYKSSPLGLSRLGPGILAYYPNHTKVNDILIDLQINRVNNDTLLGLMPFNDAKEMEDFARNDDKVFAAVEFQGIGDSSSELPEDLKIKLRFRSETEDSLNRREWFTNFLYPAFVLPGPRDSSNRYGGDPGIT